MIHYTNKKPDAPDTGFLSLNAPVYFTSIIFFTSL